MTVPYGEGAEAERFESSKFLVFSNRIVALLVAEVVCRLLGESSNAAPPYRYSFCATSNILSSVCQYEALKYVSFPTQVLAKSCKMMPVMLMAYVVSRRSYPLLDWAVAILVTGGAFLFKVAGSKGGGKGGEPLSIDGEALGYVLIIGYMAFDSFTSNWQESLFREYQPSSVLMMKHVNLFSSIFTAAGLVMTMEAFTVPVFLAQHLDCAAHVLFMALCSAVGQLFIFFTIKEFGALVFATINTVRTMLSVILSFVIFGHALNAGEAAGIATVFGALFLQVGLKWTRKQVVAHQKKAA